MENKREIKFRAWWIEAKIMVEVETVRKGGYIEFFVPVHSGEKTWNEIQILDESSQYELMQYTGLKDKNGKEIYEGDIVKMWIGEKSRTVGAITYGGWQYSVTMEVAGKDKTNYFGYNSEDVDPEKLEIIGNVFENPELL